MPHESAAKIIVPKTEIPYDIDKLWLFDLSVEDSSLDEGFIVIVYL
jgi:hypothetical protein